jgi:uncharacterized protein (TIGR03118 family)
MGFPFQPWRSYFRRKESGRPCSYRPVFECLEDRSLLSGGYFQIDLASDIPGLARVTDANLVHPWGVAFSPTGPFWVAENGSGVSDVLDGQGQTFLLVVTVPSAAQSDSAPTGVVFNGGSAFTISADGRAAPSRFLFAGGDGTISGWSNVVDPTRALLAVDNSASGAVYTGLTLAKDRAGRSFLYAADFSQGTIAIFDQSFRAVVHPGSFQDPNLPAGYAPFNIENIGNLLFVTYAKQDENRRDDSPGPGHGFIDVYDTNGGLIRRFASFGALNSPWGLAMAPADFGRFANALLVGNNGDGHIDAFDPLTGNFLGSLRDDAGSPIAIPDLWALTLGNGHVGGDSSTLFFSAGVDYDQHGLFGAIQAPGRRGTDTGGSGIFDPHVPGEPGDYPLPPSRGPTFWASNLGQPTSDLFPIRNSALALVPTLSMQSQPGTSIEVAIPVARVRGSTGSTSSYTPVSFIISPGDEKYQATPPERDAPVPLDILFDVSVPVMRPKKTAAMQRSRTDRHDFAVLNSSRAVEGAQTEDLLTAIWSQLQGVSLSEPNGSAESLASNRGELTIIPSGSFAQSADTRSEDTHAQTGNGDRWGKLMDILLLGSLSTLGSVWRRREMEPRPGRGRLT